MPSYSKNDVVLVEIVYSDLSSSKTRPGVVVHAPHPSQDIFVVPLSSRLDMLLPGEFLLSDWGSAGLHVPSAVKRGLFTVHTSLVLKRLGQVSPTNAAMLDQSLRQWLGL
jgi:mRNA interferase MazF